MSTLLQNRAHDPDFWKHIDKVAEEVSHWPVWMGGLGIPESAAQPDLRLQAVLDTERALCDRVGETLREASKYLHAELCSSVSHHLICILVTEQVAAYGKSRGK